MLNVYSKNVIKEKKRYILDYKKILKETDEVDLKFLAILLKVVLNHIILLDPKKH